MSTVQQMTCFNPLPPPSMALGSDLIVGGTWLLPEFLQLVASEREGRLSLAVPFVEQGIAGATSAWGEMHHNEIDLLVVTSGLTDAHTAWSEFGHFSWRSLLICQCQKLHSKVYSFLSEEGSSVCLIGSHNLTRSGMKGNLEAGVLLRATGSGAGAFQSIVDCNDYVSRLAKAGQVVIDRRQWPLPGELDK
jgi:PLD-like domain